MKLEWQDLPKPMSVFTMRSAEMIDLDKRKIVQYYSANTKIRVTQKCVTPEATYYRTSSAAEKGLNWAFKAAAFGLPNEVAPPAHATITSSFNPVQPAPRTSSPVKKQTSSQKPQAPKGGEGPERRSFWKKLFRRRNG